MADIFISYARPDQEKVGALAAALEERGFSVWLDRMIGPGSEYSRDIEHELERAGVVLVCWSEASAESRWVRDEASAGAEAGKLIAVSLDQSLPPMGFRQFQTADLSGWPERGSEGFQQLTETLAARTNQAPQVTAPPSPTPEKPRSQKPLFLAAGLGAVALLAGWLFFLAPFSGERSGMDEPLVEAPQRIEQPAIAVLPFMALSTDANDDFFGKGLAEELLNALARIDNLDVVARTSAFSFQGSDAPIDEIADRLGVNYIVDGSVRRSGDELRITAQLVRASDGFQLWTETYERRAADVFSIEDDIVRKVAGALQVRLGVGEYSGLPTGEAVDPKAYENYLRGLTIYQDRMREDGARGRAQEAIKAALDIDPDFGPAWAVLAQIGVGGSGSPLSRDHDAWVRQTDEAFERALALLPNDGDVHALHAGWLAREKLDLIGAQAALDRAQQLSANSATTLAASSLVLRLVGDLEGASEAFDRAARLDSLNINFGLSRAFFLAQIGNHEEAFPILEQCFEETCMREGFLAFVMAYAAHTEDQELIDRWWPRYQAFEAVLPQVPPSLKPRITEILPTLMSLLVGRPTDEAEITQLIELFETDPILEYAGLWGPLLADILPEDIYFGTLERMHEEDLLFSHIHALDPFYGVNPYPEWVRRHPRYHAIWETPGMKALAEARRSNGWEAGLPLPIEP
ncbi:TIR domain-containing protein [Parvularcula sp. ZS-1/3]|uniref:TIR domain-containing protein n=1 Tax=Parvularcula mediterranea TaxID=2732508 RepID=A0A7Y3RP38_9PROT|nr:TIR domain-containing protein [Parvularcula mediterranea]NNU17684.1 TIR domain-containing protein [Parvularcula mediterranea]